jgi:stage V sporulation protein R
MDLKRICEEPTDEDREWFPDLIGKDWRDVVQEAAFEYRDESFIQQFLSPHLIRKWRFWTLDVDHLAEKGIVTEVSDARGYKNIREKLALYFARINWVPDISVYSAAMKKNRELVLEYKPYLERSLYEPYMIKTMKHVHQLWGYPVRLVEHLYDEGEIYDSNDLFVINEQVVYES